MQADNASPVQPFERWWPTVIDATHVIISGDTGSGKTTTVKAIMLDLARQGFQFVLVDPHAKLDDWGADIRPLAAGRRFNEARRVFAWGTRELDQRYKARADHGTTDFPPVCFIVDEYDLFTDKRPDIDDDLRDLASRFLSMIGDESRKVGIRLIVLTHGTEVENLGIKGRGSKRRNYTLIELRQGANGTPEATGRLMRGSTTWIIDTTTIPQHAVGTLRPAMLVVIPDAIPATKSDDADTQRYIDYLERQLKQAQQKVQRVEVPVVTADQLAALTTAVRPLVEALARVQPPATSKPHAPPPSTAQPAPAAPPAPDAVDEALRIPGVAAKIALLHKRLKSDSTSQGYVVSTVRLLWDRTLTANEIAERRGSLSQSTIKRLRSVCEALDGAGLLKQPQPAHFTVDHDEIKRLRRLAEG